MKGLKVFRFSLGAGGLLGTLDSETSPGAYWLLKGGHGMDPEKNAKFHALSTPADKSSMARNLRADTLWCSLPQPFLQKSEKFPFHLTVEERALFILALFAGGLRELLTSSGAQKKDEQLEIFFFPLWVFRWVKRKFGNIVQCCLKSFERLVRALFFSFLFLPVKSANVGPLEERVSMLHPYRMESYLIPSVSILFCLFSYFSHFTSAEAVQPFSISLVFIADFQQENACEWGPTAGVFHPTQS